MIDVQEVVKGVPHFDVFCSVEKLHRLVEELRSDPGFTIRVAGTSVKGLPIHHLRFGKGSVKALFVGFPHCKEPICGMTVFSLMTLLHRRHAQLANADVEWHIVPCIDPDGAILNESWTQKPLTMTSYMKNFYVQAPDDQVDTSFPVRHKKLVWTQQSHEAKVMQAILAEVRPDFFFSLHNAWVGGAFFMLTRDIDHKYHRALHEHLERQRFPLQTRPIWHEVCEQYGKGISELWSLKKHYDHLESITSSPEKLIPRFGCASWDYLAEIKPEALTFINEMGYVTHPDDESERDTGESLRKFKLRLDADIKYLGSVLLEEWEKTKDDVDKSSPLYRSLEGGSVLPTRDTLPEGGRPLSLHPTRDILFNPSHSRRMTESDRFQASMVEGGFWGLCHMYQFVRLLKVSAKTPAIESAIDRLEHVFDEALAGIAAHVDFAKFKVTPYDTLARVQLGSGLVVLNSLLEH